MALTILTILSNTNITTAFISPIPNATFLTTVVCTSLTVHQPHSFLHPQHHDSHQKDLWVEEKVEREGVFVPIIFTTFIPASVLLHVLDHLDIACLFTSWTLTLSKGHCDNLPTLGSIFIHLN